MDIKNLNKEMMKNLNKKAQSIVPVLMGIILVVAVFSIGFMTEKENKITGAVTGMEDVTGEMVKVTGMETWMNPSGYTMPQEVKQYLRKNKVVYLNKNNNKWTSNKPKKAKYLEYVQSDSGDIYESLWVESTNSWHSYIYKYSRLEDITTNERGGNKVEFIQFSELPSDVLDKIDRKSDRGGSDTLPQGSVTGSVSDGVKISNEEWTVPVYADIDGDGNKDDLVGYQGESGTYYGITTGSVSDGVKIDGEAWTAPVSVGGELIGYQGESGDFYDKDGKKVGKLEDSGDIVLYSKAKLAEMNYKQLLNKKAYELTNQLLNTLLGEFAYGKVQDWCKEEWDASEPNSKTPIDTSPGPGTTNNSDCPHNLTTFSAQGVKTNISIGFQYDVSWTIRACKEEIKYNIYLANSKTDREAVGLPVKLEKGKVNAETKQFSLSKEYKSTCFMVSDTSVGDSGWGCFEFVEGGGEKNWTGNSTG